MSELFSSKSRAAYFFSTQLITSQAKRSRAKNEQTNIKIRTKKMARKSLIFGSNLSADPA